MPDRRRRAVAGAVMVVALVVGAPGPVAAESVTATQFWQLAERAAGDPRALAELRAVRQVDGRLVDMGRALGGTDGPALAARLRALAGDGVAPAVSASDARQQAEDVLAGRRFTPAKVPRPLAGVLRTLGRWLEPVLDPLGRLWDRLTASLAARLALVGAVFALAVVLWTMFIGRRSPSAVHRSHRRRADAEDLDPDDLDRQARDAERAGDLDRAVRLRFVAGVLRLDRAGVLTSPLSLTTGQLRARLRSASFAELAADFDEIAYGGRPAEEADVRAAIDGWRRVLAEACR